MTFASVFTGSSGSDRYVQQRLSRLEKRRGIQLHRGHNDRCGGRLTSSGLDAKTDQQIS
jgi:hypothetical protein